MLNANSYFAGKVVFVRKKGGHYHTKKTCRMVENHRPDEDPDFPITLEIDAEGYSVQRNEYGGTYSLCPRCPHPPEAYRGS